MTNAQTSHPDVLIVLGAALTRKGLPSPSLERRVRHALALYREGVAPAMLLTGGAKRGLQSEAHAMARLVEKAGVPEDAVVLEEMAKTTFDNAQRCEHIMRSKRWASAVVVTDDFHLRRTLLAFRSVGIQASGSPACARSDVAPLRWALYALREWAYLIWYSATIAGRRLRRPP